MVFRDSVERKFDRLVRVEAYFVNEAVEPLLVEKCLHSAEHGLNRVELGAVADIVDRRDVKLLIEWLYIFRLMHRQIIHKECY